MAQTHYYNDYNDRIVLLRYEGDQLLKRIQMLEIGMNRRKQRNEKPLDNEVIALHAMAKKLLRLLAEIYTCTYFTMTRFNGYYYQQIVQRHFEYLMQKFMSELKRRRRRRNLDCLVEFINFV